MDSATLSRQPIKRLGSPYGAAAALPIPDPHLNHYKKSVSLGQCAGVFRLLRIRFRIRLRRAEISTGTHEKQIQKIPWPFPGKPFGLPFFLGVAVVRSSPAIRNSRSHLTRGMIAGDFHPNLARIIHKFSATAVQSSALAVLCSVGLLDGPHEYDCGGLGRKPCQDGAFTASLRELMNYPG